MLYIKWGVLQLSFSSERGIPVKFCVDFNHFTSIVMSALLHSKTLKCSFLNNFRSHSHASNENVISSSHRYEFVV